MVNYPSLQKQVKEGRMNYFTLQFEKISYTMERKSWWLEAEESDIDSIWMNFCTQLGFSLCGPGLKPEGGLPSFKMCLSTSVNLMEIHSHGCAQGTA